MFRLNHPRVYCWSTGAHRNDGRSQSWKREQQRMNRDNNIKHIRKDTTSEMTTSVGRSLG